MSLNFEEPTGLTFEEPGARPRHAYAAELEEMKAHPGRWVMLGSYSLEETTRSGKIGFRIRSGIFVACRPAGSFEATQRKVDGQIRLYARYVGTDGDQQ